MAFCLTAFIQAQESKASRIIKSLDIKPLDWSVPEIGKDVIREVTDNGIVLYMMENDRLPLFEINVLFKGGEAYLPAEKMAVSGLTGSLMRKGGTKNISADSLNLLLESLGASIETGIGLEDGHASLNILSQDMELGIRLLADILRNPVFEQEKLDITKAQYQNDIKRRNDNIDAVAVREFNHLLYGEHPVGRILEWKYVRDISRDDLIAFHEKFMAPNNLMMGITGNFDQGEVKKLIDKYFGDWPQKNLNLSEIPEVADTPHPGIYQFYKDINQSVIRLGHLGIKRDNPDRYAVLVMNYILGGGSFSSRMTAKIRTDEGLTYSVGSRYQASERDYGRFYSWCKTKSESTHRAVYLLLDEINKIRDGKVTEEELKFAQDSYINQYVFGFTTPAQIVNRLMNLEFDNRPPDLIKDYLDNIRAVTRDDVLRVAREYLNPDDLTIVVVGNQENFEAPLDEFGKVINIEIKDPVID